MALFSSENIGALTALVLLLLSGLLVLAPFFSALLWAVVVVYSTWGIYARLLDSLNGRNVLAASIMTLILAAVLIVPFVAVSMSIGDNVRTLAAAIGYMMHTGLPDAPAWLGNVPLIGDKLIEYWNDARQDSTQVFAWLQAQIGPVSRWLLGKGLAFGQGLLQVVLSVLAAFYLYRDGTDVAARLSSAMERIGGEQAHRLVAIAGMTIKSVVYGIVGTALAQGSVAALGFAVAGVPGPLLLGLFTCILSLVPVGPPMIWLPATIWLFNLEQPGWALFLLIYGFTCISGIDNIVKPYLISQGSALPFLLVLLGVVGGVLAFGFIGVFLGPVIIAVNFALVRDWTRTRSAIAELKESSGDS